MALAYDYLSIDGRYGLGIPPGFGKLGKGGWRLARGAGWYISGEGIEETFPREMIVIDNLLPALVVIEGRYISIKRVRGEEDSFTFQVDASMDLVLLLQGDFLVHFMDIAREELSKKPDEISTEKLQVLEPNWHIMHNALQTAKSIDEKVERLKAICLQYAAATQLLISSSVDVTTNVETPSGGSHGMDKLKQSKTLKLAKENATVTESILKFGKEFNDELDSLGPIVSSSSQAEPYLTHSGLLG